MRARQQLGLTLMELDEFEQAAGHFNELLRLNPNDNQGNRYHLAQCLLNGNQLDLLDALLNRSPHKDDFTAEWAFTRALLEYRRNGDSPGVRRQLDEVQKRNRFVVPLLTGRAQMPPVSPSSFSPGGEDEAVVCVNQIAEGWHETSGAIEWLQSTAAKVQRRAKQWQRARDKKRKRR
jgi:tetratricopeptide (TPR) repeat protein